MITVPVFISLQIYISRGSIDTFSLVSDAAYISASLARIMRALFEICLRRGWSEMSVFMLEYCKAVDRQIWPYQHPLRQFGKELSSDVGNPIPKNFLAYSVLLGSNQLFLFDRFCGSLKKKMLTWIV